MDAELMKGYEEMADLFEEWYGINRQHIVEAFCEQGHEEILKNPTLAGLNEEQAEDFKQMFDVIKFMDAHGGRFKYDERNDF